MNADQWNRVKDLYAQVLDLPEDQRSGFLETACGDDDEVRLELESLLDSAKDLGGFMDDPLLETIEVPAPWQYPAPGDRLGIYAIVQKIGEGGMGSVYQAVRDDDAFRKLVAIKVVKRGMDTDYILQRFENEKQILAHLNHPNIAKVIDAGITPDHRPFFVMDFYSGLPLDRYCREHRPALAARIRLFQKICDAVEHAHQNLIVHRDLKPANIIITSDGEPRLLDFGIAKLLSDTRQMTRVGARVMTPGYASPEQIRGEIVNTSSDIYSLGVLLYEVLTGFHPFPHRMDAPYTVADSTLDADPKAPSTAIRNSDAKPEAMPEGVNSIRQWSHVLRGDLDKIALKALAPDPRRRYITVEQFSADLDRFLAGRPVAAAGDSVAYRITKFARRNWLAVGSGALAFLALAIALTIASYEAAKARREKAIADSNAVQLRRLAQSLVFDVHDAIETLPGATPVREKLLTRATEALDSLRTSATGDSTAQIELADVYRRLGAVHGLPSSSNLGKTQEALVDYRKSAELLENVARSKPTADVLNRLAEAYDQMARVLDTMGQRQESAWYFQKSIRAREQLIALNPKSLDAQRALAAARFTSARVEIDAGNLKGALVLSEESLKGYEAVLEADPNNENARFAVALNAKTLAAIVTKLGDYAAGVRYAARALEIDRARFKANPKDANIPLDMSFDLSELGEAEVGRNNMAAGLTNFQQALEMRENLLRADPTNERLRDRVAYMNGKIGQLLIDMGKAVEAGPYIQRQVEMLEKLSADTKNVSTRARYAAARGDLGEWHCKAGEKARGRAMLDAAIAEIKDLQAAQKLAYSDTLPLERMQQAIAVCKTVPR